jgi:hypothetical protein
MTRPPLALAGGLALLLGLPPSAGAQPKALALNAETGIAGATAACTGVGETRRDPRWLAYPVRIELANASNEYLAGAVVTVTDRRRGEVLSVSCDAPWILLKLPPGDYAAEARLLGSAARPQRASFSPPTSGQLRIVLRFPDG